MRKKVSFISIVVLALFFAGCIQEERKTVDEVTTTTTKETPITTTTKLEETTTTSTSTTTSSTSTAPTTSTTKPPKNKPNITEEECYAKNYYWCAGKCSNSPCGNCRLLRRCVLVDGVVMVETAEDSPKKEGSCVYAKNYVVAGGVGGYCDKNEGDLIHAKCGSEPKTEDCMAAYNYTQKTLFGVTQRRSFHSNLGEEFDLWCFKCSNLV